MAERAARWGDLGSGSALILLRGRQHHLSATGKVASVPSKTCGLNQRGGSVGISGFENLFCCLFASFVC